MPNPFRSEESAFRFVFLTIGYFAIVVVAWWIDKWLGLAVWMTDVGRLELHDAGTRRHGTEQ